jgi:hypothetical protein
MLESNGFGKIPLLFKVLSRRYKKRSPETFIPINNLLDKVDNLWDVLADTREAVRWEHVQGFHILIIIHIEAVLRIRGLDPDPG